VSSLSMLDDAFLDEDTTKAIAGLQKSSTKSVLVA
jgi:hypothetical protein